MYIILWNSYAITLYRRELYNNSHSDWSTELTMSQNSKSNFVFLRMTKTSFPLHFKATNANQIEKVAARIYIYRLSYYLPYSHSRWTLLWYLECAFDITIQIIKICNYIHCVPPAIFSEFRFVVSLQLSLQHLCFFTQSFVERRADQKQSIFILEVRLR